MTAPATNGAQAEIFDRGYRSYEGERTGIGAAMFSVFLASVQRALGLRRKFRFKVIPIATILLAYIPAIGFLAFAALLPEEVAAEVVEEYAGYFGLLGLAVMLFTAFVAPELMVSDRRSGMFGLYLASPLNRVHYVLAKFGSLVAVLLCVTMLPVVFLMLGYSFTGLGPEGIGETVKLLARIVAGGVLTSVFFTLIGMAAATVTNRQGFASAGIVMVLVASAVFSAVLYEEADAPAWIQLFGIAAVPSDVIARIFDEPFEQLEDVSTWASVGMWCAVCALSIAIISWGFKRMQVTK